MPTTVTLSPRIQRQAECLGQQRVMSDRRLYGRSEEDLSGDPATRHIIGVLGELAFATYYGLEINSEDDKPDPGYDFLVEIDGERTKVDVKTIQYEGGYLPVDVESVQADLYVLSYVSDPDSIEVHLLGSASRETVLNSPTKPGPQSHNQIFQVQQSALLSLAKKVQY